MFAVFHPWFLTQRKHFDWSYDPITLGRNGDVHRFSCFAQDPMFTKPTQKKHQEAARVLNISLTATFSVGPGIFMYWISQQIYWLISLKKMHYVNHTNLYTTYPYNSIHIHSKSLVYIQEYKVICCINPVHPGQTCTPPTSGGSELPNFTWSMLIWPTEKYFAWSRSEAPWVQRLVSSLQIHRRWQIGNPKWCLERAISPFRQGHCWYLCYNFWGVCL